MRAEVFGRMVSALRMCLAGLALVGLLASAAQAGNAITGLDVTNKADRIIISIQGNGALKLNPITSTRGCFLGFQIPCSLATKGRIVGVHSGRICNVRYSNFRPYPPSTRVVVNTTAHVSYSTQWSDDRKRVEITVWKFGAQPAAKPVCKTGQVSPAIVSAITERAPQADAPIRLASLDLSPAVSALARVNTEPVAPAVKVLGMVETEKQPVRSAPVAKKSANTAVKPTNVMAKLVSAAPRQAYAAEKKVSLNFLGADINDVLRALSVQSGHNIVAGKDVNGNVTVSLAQVSVTEALDYVTKLSGYSYSEDNGTYLVAKNDSLKDMTSGGEGQGVEVMPLNYCNADDMLLLLKTQCPNVNATKFSKAGTQGNGSPKTSDSSTMTASSSKIVLTGPAADVATAKQMIAQVDESMKTQVTGQKTEVYRVKYVKPSELAKALVSLVPGISVGSAPGEGFELNAPDDIQQNEGGSKVSSAALTAVPAVAAAGGTNGVAGADQQISFDQKTKSQSLVIVGQSADVQAALDLAVQLDIKAPQIKIDAKITSLTKSGEKKLGVSWDWGSFTKLEGFSTADSDTTNNVPKANGAWFRQPFDFSATLEAIITNGDGELLASPSLMCLEGKPGVFFVGDEVTYIQRIETTPTGQNITTDTKQVGVQLRAIGDVSPDGYITLNLHPEVSVIRLNEGQGITLPIVTRRFTDHVVRVKTGETIVIGGLIRNEEIEEMRKVPILGDLPFFGNLFRHKSKSSDHSEVVMFITASVIQD